MSNLNKMNIRGNKTAICAISLILVLAVSTFAIMMPRVNAQAIAPGINLPQWAYINAFPTPVGVGQTISIFAWTANLPTTAGGAYGDRWTGITINIVLPDGSNTTLGPFTSDPVGTTFQTYTPTETGNYTFQAFFPGHLMTMNPNGIDPAVLTPTFLANAQAYATAHNVSMATAEIALAAAPYYDNYYAACQSDAVTVTVQSGAIPNAPAYPLPTEYWSTPVSQSGHSPLWVYVTGDWLAQGIAPNYQGTSLPPNNIGGIINDFTQPPTTAHIAWTKPINFGGVAGNPQQLVNGGDNYYSYLSYETMNAPGIIMNGQYYYNTPNPPEYGFTDLNLATGQVVWYQNGTNAWSGTGMLGENGASTNPNGVGVGSFNKNNYPQLSFGQELDYESPNQHGMIDTLWSVWAATNGSNVWSAFDPMTGNWICNLWNVPGYAVSFGSPTLTTDAFGDMIIYTPNLGSTPIASTGQPAKTLGVWNSTQAIENVYETYASLRTGTVVYGNSSNSYWFYRPALGAQIDSSRTGVTYYNITGTIPTTTGYGTVLLFAVDQADQELIYTSLPSTLGSASYPTTNQYIQYAISINPTNAGQILWSQVYTRPAGNVTVWFSQNNLGQGVFAMMQKETRLWMGFSTTNGNLLWTAANPEIDNHMYGVTGGIDNGILYSGDSSGTGGQIYGYNVTTGALMFDTQSGSMGYGGYWINTPSSVKAIAAGNVYWGQAEHSPGPNLEPTEYIGDINGTTGAPIWNITCWPGAVSISGGYLVVLNNYDNQLYSFGKGPTQTTVQTPLVGINQGQNLVIQGSVLDKSSGTTQDTIAKRFPNGVAAVSDDSQTEYMEYVYMQNPVPGNATGVPVTIDVVDPNGNYINLGTATSDMSGHYSFAYTAPTVPGTYSVIATFHGSNSYWPSYSESTFSINNAASPTTAPTATPTSAADMYFVPAIAGLFVLIIVVAIVLALLMLRKHP